MAAVVFDYGVWSTRYPELAATVNAQLAASYFAEACLYAPAIANGTLCVDPNTALLLMNMATAHVAKLNAPQANGQAASPLVGRINSATEGSVSVFL